MKNRCMVHVRGPIDLLRIILLIYCNIHTTCGFASMPLSCGMSRYISCCTPEKIRACVDVVLLVVCMLYVLCVVAAVYKTNMDCCRCFASCGVRLLHPDIVGLYATT